MIAAPIPSHEAARLAALHRYQILDTSSEPAFDELARLAAYVCRTPIAVISFVDSSRQWFKSTEGLPFAECPRSEAFCAHTILGTDLFIVEEAAADERFADHPWVVESPSISFYAGTPLITPDGQAIGSLAVMDVVPRTLTPEQCAYLGTIANQVMMQVALRNGREAVWTPPVDSAVHEACDQGEERLRHSEARLKEVQCLAQIGDWELDLQTNILLWSDEIYRIFEVDSATFRASYEGFLDLVHPDDREMVDRVYSDSIGQQTPYDITHRLLMKNGRIKVVHERGVTHYFPDGTPSRSVGTVQDITERKQAEEALRLSRERLHQALQASGTGLWEWNTETGEVSFSKEWKSQLGYGESELPDSFETWASRLHPDDRDQAILYAQRYRDNPVGVFRQDFRLRHKDGSYRWIDSHASFVTEADGRRIRLLGSHTDITERKQAEDALQLAKFTVDCATDAMYWVGADARLLDVNEAACAMLGYSKEEFRRMTVHDINPYFQVDSWPTFWEEARRRGAVSFESFHRAKDGRLIPIEVNVSGLSYQGRECHCAFVRDITGRRQVEEERARALNNLQTIMETVPDIIFALDLEGRLSKWNLRMEVVTGYAPIELSGKPALEMVPLEEAERTAAAIREAFETGYAELEGHLLTKDGRTIPYHWTGAPFTDLQGRVIGITGVGRDITERRHAEALLRFSEERFRLVAEATNDILWDWDLVTREHWWSPNAREKFGYDHHAEPGISAWTDRLHPDDRERVMAIVDQALASETRMVTAEYRFRLADGSYGHFYDRGQIVRDASGKPSRLIGAMIDVTFSKRAYASLEAAYQRLQSLSRELQTVEANERRRLSRELHDEVGQMLTALKFDLEATRQALDDHKAVSVDRARERTRRALETTDELFARLRGIVRALRPPVLEELGLKEALEAMVSDFRSRTDLMCSISLEAEALEALTDSTMEAALYRMAQELATNVVRHAQAMTLSVALTLDSHYWILTVQDDGIGFDPQAESISGMGIRGVRERAEILGGRVNFSSTPGSGSTVTVWIPVTATRLSGVSSSDL